MMEPANNNSSGLVGEPPAYNIACAIPQEVNKSGIPLENFVNTTDSAGSSQTSPIGYPSPTPPPPAAFLSPEPVLHLPESTLGKSDSAVSAFGHGNNSICVENKGENSEPGTPQCRWSFSSDQPINFNSDDESFPPPPPEFMTEEERPTIQFSYSTDSDSNFKKQEKRKNRRPPKTKQRRVESLSPVPAAQDSTSPDGVSSAHSNDSASTNLASGSDIHLRPPSDRVGKQQDHAKRMKPYASPMLPKDIMFKSLEVSSYDDESARGSGTEHDLETDHDDVHTPLLQDGAGSPAKISNHSILSAGTRNSYPSMLGNERMRNYTLDSDVRLPLLKINSDPRESRKSRDRLNKQDSKSDALSSPEIYDVRLGKDGSYPAEAEIMISNDDISVSNLDIPNTLHTGNAIGYAESCDSELRGMSCSNNKRDSAGKAPWRPGQTVNAGAVDTMPKEPKKQKKPFRSRSYPICIAVSFTTMLCINPPIGVVAVFLSYLSWKAYDKGDKTAGYCLARLSLYVSIGGIVTTMTLVITILYQTTIGF